MSSSLARFLYEKEKAEIDPSEDQYELQLALAREDAEKTARLYERWLVEGVAAFQPTPKNNVYRMR